MLRRIAARLTHPRVSRYRPFASMTCLRLHSQGRKVKLSFFSFCLRDVCSWKSDSAEGVGWHWASLPRVMAATGARQMDVRWLAGLEIAATNHGKTMRVGMRMAVTSQLFQSRRHNNFG
jgi:hypothetical protein